MFMPGLQAEQSASAAPTDTVVSLTFDDGHSSHASTLSMLGSRGMAGTYYINSAMVGSSPYYMTWPQVHALADAGNEIGGHTLHHTNLTNVSPAVAQQEVCTDRQNLLNQGFSPVTSFAYPEAGVNATAKQVVQQCGFTTGRDVGNIYSNGACGGCPYAESIPPADAYRLRTPESAGSTTSLSQLQSYVTDAETHGGGWVILTFHGICNNGCTGSNSVSTSTFTAFLDWLQPRSANGTVVRTINQATGTPTPPPAPGPPSDTTGPSVALTSPTGGTFRRNAAITVQASATDSGTGGGPASGMARVVFRDGASTLATDTTAPYRITWRSTQLGSHTLTAVATDVAGNSTTSAPVTVTIIR
jgi:peptidoglycan/xylan/chitin deacetylase (PgdA/CDA1 family)